MLERRRRIDQALYAVVMEAWVNGVSTRNVDALVVALGGTGISKSEVSRICGQLDEEVGRFRTRRLDAVEYPFVFLDATYLHVRTDHLVTSKAVVVATAVAADGRREILGVDVGDREDEVFWHGFLGTRWPKIGPHMDAAKTEVLAFNAFPRAHWRKIWSTNPLERLNKEIKRRARVVGIFPNEASVIRLVGMILTDTNDEWITDERRYLSEGSMALLYPDTDNGPIAAITDGNV